MNFDTMQRFLQVTLVLIFGIIGCSQVVDKGESEKPKTLPRELTDNEKQVVEADRSFSYDLFRETISHDSTNNIFISPLSVSMALGMTLNGAAGETQTAIKKAIRLQGLDLPAINESYSSLIELLRSADPKVNMKLANSIWYRQGFSVEEDFKEKCKEFFEARIESLDFADPSAADKINEWVSSNTDGLIDKIIEGSIPQEMVMYLINAIYFKGDWQYQFDPEKTKEQAFFTGDDTIHVDMMSQENTLAAYVSDEVQMLDIPYGDSLFTMTLMMPGNRGIPINNFVKDKLNSENMEYWISQMSVDTTDVFMPKFELQYEVKMNEMLKSMGMQQAFDRNGANFSNINPSIKMFISEVRHKSFVQVDEEGTEAGAVTSVGLQPTSAGPKVRTLRFNRPFVFVIRERTSGTILFMGKVNDPSQVRY